MNGGGDAHQDQAEVDSAPNANNPAMSTTATSTPPPSIDNNHQAILNLEEEQLDHEVGSEADPDNDHQHHHNDPSPQLQPSSPFSSASSSVLPLHISTSQPGLPNQLFTSGGTGHYPFFSSTDSGGIGVVRSGGDGGGGGGGSYSTTTTEPATPTSLFSEQSECAPALSDSTFSPSVLASSGKRFWSESSSWLISRIAYHHNSQSSSSAYSSMDRSSSYGKCYRDPSSVERSNLLNITKLVIKELIEWSIRHGRSLESDHPPLQHFFIVLEHAMRHGLKPKKGLLGPKKELWDVLQLVERCTSEAQDITASIRDLPTVNTHLGRARAWLRLALMQKKLADYFKLIVDRRDDLLQEFYEPFALMMSDEAPVLGGLLVGLNVIDCNFCLKEEDLDTQQGVIDFSLYLRSSRSSESPEDEQEQANKFDSVLDQKNYIEELNRHLNSTVANLQTRVETLTTTNALMKEDLAISKNTILALQEENRQLKQRHNMEQQLKRQMEASAADQLESSSISISSNQNQQNNYCSSDTEVDAAQSAAESDGHGDRSLSVTELSKKLLEERMTREKLEKDLEYQKRMKEEVDTAMKLMEKDVHEKQDTIISLRSQLDDIKMINLEMYKKLQECEKSLKFKSDLATKLEEKNALLDDTINKLEEKIKVGGNELKSSHETMRNLGKQIAEKELKVSTLEGDLRIEREWRQSLQESDVKDKEEICKLNMEIQKLQLLKNDLETSRLENHDLHRICREQEEALAEMGAKYREKVLKEDGLREASATVSSYVWRDSRECTHCKECTLEFTLTRRKHHCRNCGDVFCQRCSDNQMELPSHAKPVRVCDPCFSFLLERCNNPGGTVPPVVAGGGDITTSSTVVTPSSTPGSSIQSPVD